MKPIIVTQLFYCNLEKTWKALSNLEELRKWYFPIQDYLFEVGKEFTFYGSEESKQYFHRCKFINIIPEKIIEYTWTHPNDSKGSSIVKWEIESKGDKTLVTLTHSGVETFSDAGNDYSLANYEMGWSDIVKTMLRNYLYGIEKLIFEIEINTTATKLWQLLWDKQSYTNWTEPFCAGTYILGDLKQGNRVHFLSPSGEGMYSDVAFLKENKLMFFKHIGMLKDKKELPLDEETEKWTGCFESYTLIENNNNTKLKVEVDAVNEYKDYMKKTFPLALNRLKKIAENNL